MNKILVVINAHQPNMTLIDFACSIATMTQSRLTGLIVDNLYHDYHIPENENELFSKTISTKTNSVRTDTTQAVKIFKEECEINKVLSETYVDAGEPIQQVIYESRFADLLILDPKLDFYDVEEQLPSHFTKEILANAECPVLLAPENPINIDKVVFCYDGTSSSVFALKQFTYLFPGLKNRKALLLEVNRSGKEVFSEDHHRLMGWLQTHYNSVEYYALKGQAKEELFEYFFMKKNEAIIMGSYGRNVLSSFFKHSTADILIRTIDLPIFITHNKH